MCLSILTHNNVLSLLLNALNIQKTGCMYVNGLNAIRVNNIKAIQRRIKEKQMLIGKFCTYLIVPQTVMNVFEWKWNCCAVYVAKKIEHAKSELQWCRSDKCGKKVFHHCRFVLDFRDCMLLQVTSIKNCAVCARPCQC